MWAELGLVIASYLFGSLPVVYLLGRWRGVDLRATGSGNIGAENLWRSVGPVEGLLGAASDVTKGAAPVLAGQALHLDPLAVGLAGVAGLAGQCWPLFLNFHGGRGNSTGLGMALALSPGALVLGILPAVLAIILRGIRHLLNRRPSQGKCLHPRFGHSRSIPLAMLLGFIILPLAGGWLQEEAAVTLALWAVLFIVVLRRLTADLRRDLRQAAIPKRSLLWNRLLYDRSYL